MGQAHGTDVHLAGAVAPEAPVDARAREIEAQMTDDFVLTSGAPLSGRLFGS